MRYAIEHSYDYVITMDADFSHHPRYIAHLLSSLEAAPTRRRRHRLALCARWAASRDGRRADG